jgi:predicted ArsR family transcriptional regulator
MGKATYYKLGERQQWILAQLADGVRLTRWQVKKQFDISRRTAKRELGELVRADMVEFDCQERPGHYRLKS